MDLNKAMVKSLSAQEGGRYCSADDDKELARVVARDFAYDVTVIARDIKLSFKSDRFEVSSSR